MSDQHRVVITLRPGEAVTISGPARVVVQDIPDNRVELAIQVEPGTEVVRERRR